MTQKRSHKSGRRSKLTSQQKAAVAFYGNSVGFKKSKCLDFIAKRYVYNGEPVTFSDQGWADLKKELMAAVEGVDEICSWDPATMMAKGIPDTNLKRIHDIYKRIVRKEVPFMKGASRPTYRQLKYWNMLLTFYSDDIRSDFDIICISNLFVEAELMESLEKEQPRSRTTAIADWLIAKPFADVDSYKKYITAPEEPVNWIPPNNGAPAPSNESDYFSEWELSQLLHFKIKPAPEFGIDDDVIKVGIHGLMGMSPTEVRYLLPSQVVRYSVEKFQNINYMEMLSELFFMYTDIHDNRTPYAGIPVDENVIEKLEEVFSKFITRQPGTDRQVPADDWEPPLPPKGEVINRNK